MLQAGEPEAFLPTEPSNDSNRLRQRAQEVEREIADLENQIQRMILKQASADASVHDQYEQAIRNTGNRRQALKEHLLELQRQIAGPDYPQARRMAYDEIAERTVEQFWKLDDRTINDLLHRLMGARRFVVSDGEIIGVADAPARKKRY